MDTVTTNTRLHQSSSVTILTQTIVSWFKVITHLESYKAHTHTTKHTYLY